MLLWNAIDSGLFSVKYTRSKVTSGRIAKEILQDEGKLQTARKIDHIADKLGLFIFSISIRLLVQHQYFNWRITLLLYK